MAPLAWSRRLVLWAFVFALAPPLRAAGPVEKSVAVYAAPSVQWSAAVTPALPNFHAQDLGIQGSQLAANAQSLAPVVHQLQAGLGLTPQKFAAMSPVDQQTVLGMAAEQAQHDLMQKSYELVGEAKALVWAKDGLEKSDLDDLYRVAAQLREIDRAYGPFLKHDEREVVAMSAKQTAERWREARANFIKDFGEAGVKALETGKEKEAGVAVSPARTIKPLNPGGSAKKLRERMQGTKSGWGEKDFETLYVGYGFTFRDGAKHRMYTHPVFPHLHTTVSRQRDLPPGYAQEALKLISELEALSAPKPVAQARVEDDDLPPPLTNEAVKAAEKAKKQAAKPQPVQLAEIAVSPKVASAFQVVTTAETKPAPVKTAQAEPPAVESKPAPKLDGPLPAPQAPEEKKPGWSLREWLKKFGRR